MKKRLGALLLAAAMVCSLASCGKKVSSDAAGEQTLDVDVAVIGAGGAGMTAAIAAAQAGRRVVILEKTDTVGGNSLRATGGMNAAKTEWQDGIGFYEYPGLMNTLDPAATEYPQLSRLVKSICGEYVDWTTEGASGYFDCPNLFILDTMLAGECVNDSGLVSTLVKNSAAAMDWLESIGAELQSVVACGGSSVKRLHCPVDEKGKLLPIGSYLVPILEQTCVDNGVDIIFNAPVTEILMKGKKVAGVKAVGCTVNAKSVIIASGGFGADLKLISELKPELDGLITTNAPGCTGDGIRMALAVGAATVDMERIQLHPTVEQKTSTPIAESLRKEGAILVNQEGLRFCDETDGRDALSAAELAQTGGYAWLVVDQRMAEDSDLIGGYIKKGYTLRGDTYEALARDLGVPEEALAQTMEQWNACVASGADARFGRTSFAGALDTAPFYAIRVTPGVHYTMGGLKINTSAQVLDADGNEIPGLFAAGEVTGGVHGADCLEGSAITDFVVFGRLAGQFAAAYAK